MCSQWGEPSLSLMRFDLRGNSESGNKTTASTPFIATMDEPIFPRSGCKHAEFSRTGLQDMSVATFGKVAKLFDVATSQCITELFPSAKQSEYDVNKAAFLMDGHLVLNDGVVWDVRSRVTPTSPVHKMDKFQDVISTVQALDKFESIFSDIIYAACFDRCSNSSIEDYSESSIQTIFHTVDALDYSLIASIDVKHPIVRLAVDTRDLLLAVEENFHDNIDNLGQCRVYSIGQKKSAREMENDEDGENSSPSYHDDDEMDDIIFRRSFYSQSSDEDDVEDQSTSSVSSESSGGSESSWVTEEEMEVSTLPDGNGSPRNGRS
nr:DDB1 and CUL4 associated factor 1 [Hymenolepis microstoma]